MKKLLLTILLASTICSPCYSAVENFTTGWTETDPNSRLSQTATRSTWAGLTLNEWTDLRKNGGINFTGNFDVSFDFRVDSSSSQSNEDAIYALLFQDSTANFHAIGLGRYNSKVYIGVQNGIEGGSSEFSDFDNTLSCDTVYYARFRRDESVGTNGTLYLDIYGSSANRTNNTSPLVSVSRTITLFGKVDLVFAACPLGIDYDSSLAYTSYIENLDLAYVPSSGATGRKRRTWVSQ